MITYLTITFSSEGERPSKVMGVLHSLGFEPTTGVYDCAYRWDSQATVDDALYLADRVHATLRGTGALFKMETVGE